MRPHLRPHLRAIADKAVEKVRRRPVRDDDWRLPEELWAKMEPLLPARPKHPLGCHNPRVPDRRAMDAIFSVPRTGRRWNASKETGLCSSSPAHRRFRFQEWAEAGVFEAFWREGLLAYDAAAGIAWTWSVPDGGKTGRDPTERGKQGVKRSVPTDGRGVPRGVATDGANRNDHTPMRRALEAMPVPRSEPTRGRPRHPRVDRGYDAAGPREIVARRRAPDAAEFGSTLHPRTRGEEIEAKRHTEAKARRRVVERAHSWPDRFRAVLIRWSKRPANHLALLHFACGLIAWRHAPPRWILRMIPVPFGDHGCQNGDENDHVDQGQQRDQNCKIL